MRVTLLEDAENTRGGIEVVKRWYGGDDSYCERMLKAHKVVRRYWDLVCPKLIIAQGLVRGWFSYSVRGC